MSKANKEILETANAAIAEGDFVAALGEITLKDETGKTARHSYCDVWRFREGRMAELHAFVIEVGSESGTSSQPG